MHLVLLAGLAAALARESVDAEAPAPEVRAVRASGAESPLHGSAAVVQAEGLVRKRAAEPGGVLSAEPLEGSAIELPRKKLADFSAKLAAVETAVVAPTGEGAAVKLAATEPEAGAVAGGATAPAAAPAAADPSGAKDGMNGAKDGTETGGTDDVVPDPELPETPTGTWGILKEKPWMLCLLGLGTLVFAAIFFLSITSDDDPLKGVLATVPLTPLELLPHREYQIVRTRGVVTPTAEGEKKAQLFNSPLTSELCVYSRTLVEMHHTTGWENLLDFVEARPFALAERGKEAQILCEVSAASPAVLDLPPAAVFDGDLVQLPPPVQARIRQLPGPKLPAYSMFRVSEWTFTEGQELEAMGLVLRRVSRKETRTAIGVGGLSATNADYIASLFSPMRVSRWRAVGNKVVLGLPSTPEDEK